jgi:uncharacterized membrane protein
VKSLLQIGTVCGIIAALVLYYPQSAQSYKAVTRSSTTIAVAQEIINTKIYQVGRITVKASPEQVWKVLTDYQNVPHIFSNVSRCSVVEDSKEHKLVAFKVKTCGNFFTFNYILEVREIEPISIEWSQASGAFKVNEGYWHIDASEDGQSSLVTYAKFIDAAPIPQSMVNKEIRADMPVVLGNLKDTLEKQALENTAQVN